jgi:UDP-sulfoquinovose synthase
MNVLILGGDGYLGWATAMHLSARGHNVSVVDNYLRRNICSELNRNPLVDVPQLDERAKIWKAASGHTVNFHVGDVTDYNFLSHVFRETSPDTVIHYAEQPSAPYSMMCCDTAAATVSNNLISTLNVIFAIRDLAPKCHLVKLGTMGEYGTPNIDIEEGYLDVVHNGRSDKFLFPKTPGSIYHLTKVQDSDMLYFATRTWDLAVTDLNQGPVYGIETDELAADERLAPIFNYDDVFGTVLNRFIVQAVCGFPLTVYGKGGQVRGYLNIRDTLQCVELAVNNPVEAGDFRVLNQFTETFSVNDLAAHVKKVGDEMGLGVTVKSVENPRRELEEHYYNPKNTGLFELGLQPHYLTGEVIGGMLDYVGRHAGNINQDRILPEVGWRG